MSRVRSVAALVVVLSVGVGLALIVDEPARNDRQGAESGDSRSSPGDRRRKRSTPEEREGETAAVSADPAADEASRLVENRRGRILREFIRRGDADGLRRALSEGLHPDSGCVARGGTAEAPVLLAAGAGRFDLVMILLDAGADVRLANGATRVDGRPQRRDWAAFTAGHVLMRLRSQSTPVGLEPVVRHLRGKIGPDELGRTPSLALALAVAEGGKDERVRQLLATGERPDASVWVAVETSALQVATDLRRHDLVALFVDELGGASAIQGPHRRDRYNPLALAVCAGDLDRARRLLADGAPVDGGYHASDAGAHSAYECTPLYWAAMNGQLDAVRLLLDEGADVRATFYPRETVLGGAIYGGDESVVRELIDRGAPVRTERWDALLEIVTADRPGLVRVLMQAGANADQALRAVSLEWDGEARRIEVDALALAAQWGRTAVVRTLLEMGANPDGGPAVLEFKPVEWAAYNGRTEILRMLLARGADAGPLRRPGPDGLDALERARTRGWDDLADLIAAAGDDSK